MNLFTGEASDELFGGEVPLAVRELLQQARSAEREQIPALLWTAQACSPQTLAVYYLLAKCHAGRRELELAERAAAAGLKEAASQAGLPEDWQQVQPSAAFEGTGPARFWLFMLKARAFILTRSERLEEAKALLAKLAELDPQASAGGEVVAGLVQAAQLSQAGPQAQ
jgi:hypothetical protein